MYDIRNSNGRLVCRIDKDTGTIEIKSKECVTLIEYTESGEFKITNT